MSKVLWGLLLCTQILQAANSASDGYIEIASFKKGDTGRIHLSRSAARNPNVSRVLATSLEKDADAGEIPVGIASATLDAMLPALERINTRIPGNVSWARLPEIRKKTVVENVIKIIAPDASIVDILNAAHYLDSPILLEAATWRYATLLHAEHESIGQTVRKDAIAKDLLPLISRQYFLQYNTDIDTDLGIKPSFIPLETLVAHGKLPAGKTVNELLFSQPDGLVEEESAEALRTIKALRKVKGFDPNTTPSINRYRPLHALVRQYMSSSNEDVYACIQELLESGANPNLPANSMNPYTALFFAIHLYHSPYDKSRNPTAYKRGDAAIRVMDLLIQFHANPNQILKFSESLPPESILDRALQTLNLYRTDQKIVDFLRSKGARTAAELKALKK